MPVDVCGCPRIWAPERGWCPIKWSRLASLGRLPLLVQSTNLLKTRRGPRLAPGGGEDGANDERHPANRSKHRQRLVDLALHDLTKNQLTITKVTDSKDQVVVADAWRGRGKASEIELDSCRASVWTISGGRATVVVFYAERPEPLEAASL